MKVVKSMSLDIKVYNYGIFYTRKDGREEFINACKEVVNYVFKSAEMHGKKKYNCAEIFIRDDFKGFLNVMCRERKVIADYDENVLNKFTTKLSMSSISAAGFNTSASSIYKVFRKWVLAMENFGIECDSVCLRLLECGSIEEIHTF